MDILTEIQNFIIEITKDHERKQSAVPLKCYLYEKHELNIIRECQPDEPLEPGHGKRCQLTTSTIWYQFKYKDEITTSITFMVKPLSTAEAEYNLSDSIDQIKDKIMEIFIGIDPKFVGREMNRLRKLVIDLQKENKLLLEENNLLKELDPDNEESMALRKKHFMELANK